MKSVHLSDQFKTVFKSPIVINNPTPVAMANVNIGFEMPGN